MGAAHSFILQRLDANLYKRIMLEIVGFQMRMVDTKYAIFPINPFKMRKNE